MQYAGGLIYCVQTSRLCHNLQCVVLNQKALSLKFILSLYHNKELYTTAVLPSGLYAVNAL